MCYLGFSPSALLHQAPRHGASDGEGLEERADEVTQAEGDELLTAQHKGFIPKHSKKFIGGKKRCRVAFETPIRGLNFSGRDTQNPLM